MNPVEMEIAEDNEEEDELEIQEEGVETERLRLAEDSENVKKILDPCLPTEAEIKEHYEMGHAVDRSWCE
eukprot:5323163-Karenia_brevis.AAC.1